VTGSALIVTGGVLAGGGVSGKSMLKRTSGLTEFEFINYDDAMEAIRISKIKREADHRKRLNLEISKTEDVIEKLAEEIHQFPIDSDHIDILSPKGSVGGNSKDNISSSSLEGFGDESTVMWEMESDDEDAPIDRVVRRSSNELQKRRQPTVLITVAGWQTYDQNDFTLPFSTIAPDIYGDQYSLIWESRDLQKLGSALKILGTEVATFLFQQGLAATVLPVLMAGLTGPLWAIKLTYLMDNPWGYIHLFLQLGF
jgi:hypothetical protein